LTWKLKEEFTPNKGGKLGVKSHCKTCVREASKRKYYADPKAHTRRVLKRRRELMKDPEYRLAFNAARALKARGSRSTRVRRVESLILYFTGRPAWENILYDVLLFRSDIQGLQWLSQEIDTFCLRVSERAED
jgi:hypothetical protein